MQELTWTNPVVERHALYSQCGSTLLAVAQRDYHNTNFFDSEIKCLDMDDYEDSRGGDKQYTMDAVIGVKETVGINAWLMLTELKLDSENRINYKAKEFSHKISHTLDLLGGDCRVYGTKYFVFPDSLRHRLKNRLNEMRAECSELKSSTFVTLSDFNRLISPKADDYSEMENWEASVMPLIDMGGSQQFLYSVKQCIAYARKQKRNGNGQAFHAWKKVIKKVWLLFEAAKPLLNSSLKAKRQELIYSNQDIFNGNADDKELT